MMRCIQQIVVCNWPKGKSCKIENGWPGLFSSGINYLKVVMQNIASITSIIPVHFHGTYNNGTTKSSCEKECFYVCETRIINLCYYVGGFDEL